VDKRTAESEFQRRSVSDLLIIGLSRRQKYKFMKKLDKVEILKNVGSSWCALGVNILVGILLSPYILHRLGDEAFASGF